jgi:hypothetical protein
MKHMLISAPRSLPSSPSSLASKIKTFFSFSGTQPVHRGITCVVFRRQTGGSGSLAAAPRDV